MKFDFYSLPYSDTALEPLISSETIAFHYGKHHRAYYDKLAALIEGTELADMSLEDIVKHSYNKNEYKAIYNNAAQVLNHNFYWSGLAKDVNISDFMKNKIEEAFVSLDNFKVKMKESAVAQFGSGWTWLVLKEDGTLDIMSTSNADHPLVLGMKALFVVDVWEHAYYIDKRNARPDYVDSLLNNLVNWDFVESNLKEAVN